MPMPCDISIDDINWINESYVSYMYSVGIDDIKSRMREVVLYDIDAPGHQETARKVLDEYGIVVLSSAVDSGRCYRLCDRVQAFLDQYISLGVSIYEDDNAIYQADKRKLRGYRQYSEYGKAVINVRQGQDHGMIDIFNCDYALPEEADLLISYFRDLVDGVISDKGLVPDSLNIYANRGTSKTRGFHVDSYSERIKAFIYLTDVADLDDGPYTYVKKSHLESSFLRANKALRRDEKLKTETPIVDPLAITPVLAGRGALVIADQAGVHRGWPQHVTAARTVAVMNYK